MSAFIVEDKTINKVITFLKMSRDLNHTKRMLKENGYDLDTFEGCKKLGEDMFKLNCKAVDERYGEGEAKEFRDLNYTYGVDPYYTIISAFKSLNCWNYQCSEGDVPETELYKLMEKVSNNIAYHIVIKLPEYNKAVWG